MIFFRRTCTTHPPLDPLAQGGDPTGTGEGGESIYGHPFKDEFHTRLKFNHRGLVACANANRPDTNGSQFFLTLDRADHCDRKYTIFGKVTGAAGVREMWVRNKARQCLCSGLQACNLTPLGLPLGPLRCGPTEGDTIYNLLRFNELETDDDDRPAEAPRLTRAEVLWNPFDDIIPRVDRCALACLLGAKQGEERSCLLAVAVTCAC